MDEFQDRDYRSLLHPRVREHCLPLLDNGHPVQAAHEAMKQVELALKEKSGVKNKFGQKLCQDVFGRGHGIKLRVPFAEDLQKPAEQYFAGVFSYYRNCVAHDGRGLDGPSAVRILIIASDLLNLLGASTKCFSDVGGVAGLVSAGVFPSAKQLASLLTWLEAQWFPDDVVDGFFEELAAHGFSEDQLQAAYDLGLAEWVTTSVEHDLGDPFATESITRCILTPLGMEAKERGHGNP